VIDSLDLQGSPAWTLDGRYITSAANDRGVPHLSRCPSTAVRLLPFFPLARSIRHGSSGRFVVYSGPDIGAMFTLKTLAPDGQACSLPRLTVLTRVARHLKFLSGGRELAVLRGGIEQRSLADGP